MGYEQPAEKEKVWLGPLFYWGPISLSKGRLADDLVLAPSYAGSFFGGFDFALITTSERFTHGGATRSESNPSSLSISCNVLSKLSGSPYKDFPCKLLSRATARLTLLGWLISMFATSAAAPKRRLVVPFVTEGDLGWRGSEPSPRSGPEAELHGFRPEKSASALIHRLN